MGIISYRLKPIFNVYGSAKIHLTSQFCELFRISNSCFFVPQEVVDSETGKKYKIFVQIEENKMFSDEIIPEFNTISNKKKKGR